jgi:hypothetical protein
MSETREKITSILLKFRGKTRKIELFPSERWADRMPGVEPGLFRVRMDGAWLSLSGEKYDFLGLAGINALVSRLIGEGTGLVGEETPLLPKGSRVSVPNGNGMFDVLFTLAEPIQGVDGRYRVFVVGRREPYLVSDLRVHA